MEQRRHLDSSLRLLQNEHTSSNFTSKLMKTLGIREEVAFIWKLFESLAPLILLTVIFGVVFLVVQSTSTIDNSEFSKAIETLTSSYRKISHDLGGNISTLSNFVSQFIPLNFAGNGFYLIIFLICFLASVGLLDKYIFSMMMNRNHHTKIIR